MTCDYFHAPANLCCRSVSSWCLPALRYIDRIHLWNKWVQGLGYVFLCRLWGDMRRAVRLNETVTIFVSFFPPFFGQSATCLHRQSWRPVPWSRGGAPAVRLATGRDAVFKGSGQNLPTRQLPVWEFLQLCHQYPFCLDFLPLFWCK